jgi:hypothetical protein
MSVGGDQRRRRALVSIAALAVGAVAAVVLASSGRSPHRHRPPAPLTTSTAVTLPAPPPPATEQFGASVNRLFNDRFTPRGFTAQQIATQLQALRRTGATIARSDALWEAAEPEPPAGGVHRYDWSFDDSIAGSLAAHGLLWLPIVDYSPPWAQSPPRQTHSPPRSSDYAAFAAALAARYGPGGAFWRAHVDLQAEPVRTYEIWNEPDSPGFWQPAPNAGQYAELYLRARAAILAVDPGARVIVGGLTSAASFLPAMLAATPALRGRIDGVGIHPYGANPLVVLANVRVARDALASLRLGPVPLYVTEFGWTTSPPGAFHYLPSRLRPDYIETTIADLGRLNCGVAATVLYTWVTPERDPRSAEDWFGINPPSGGPSPDSQAFARGVRQALAPAPAIRLCAAG